MKKEAIIIGLLIISIFLFGCISDADMEKHKKFCNDLNGKYDPDNCYINGTRYEITNTQDGLTLYTEQPASKSDAFVGGMVGGMLGGMMTSGGGN